MSTPNKFMIEGLDRLGKDTLIQGIQHKHGYHQILHYSKPVELDCYVPCPTGMSAKEIRSESTFRYQEASFRTMFSLFRDATYSRLICNRAHLGECVYAPLYRNYSGEYVFELERTFNMAHNRNTRLILLLEDFAVAKHFTSDGESFDDTKRETEQELFIDAFEKSCIPDKRMIVVTDTHTGGFRDKQAIIQEALA